MIIKAPGGTVTVPCRMSRPPSSSGPSQGLLPPCPCASQGLASCLQPTWLLRSLFPLPSLGTGAGGRCWVWVLLRGAAGKEWRREQGTDTPSLPTPQVSPALPAAPGNYQVMPLFLSKARDP